MAISHINGIALSGLSAINGISAISAINGLSATLGGASGTEFVTSFDPTGLTLRNDFTGRVGFVFTIPSGTVDVTHLGRWVVAGNSGSHDIYLYSGDAGNVGTVLASVTVNTSGAPDSEFLYEEISGGPVTLTTGVSYWLFSEELNAGDEWYSHDADIVTTAVADALHPAGYFGSLLVSEDMEPADRSYVPVSFKYT